MKFKVRCKACQESRDNKDVDVRVVKTDAPGGIKMQQNFQYCNDRPNCRKTAEEWEGYPGI